MVGWPRKGFTIAYTDTLYALATWPGAYGVLPDSPESERKLSFSGKKNMTGVGGWAYVCRDRGATCPSGSCPVVNRVLDWALRPTLHEGSRPLWAIRLL